MRFVMLTALAMCAFAANSLLNRAALLDGTTGPAAFAAIRLASGAVALVVIAQLSSQKLVFLAPKRLWGTAALLLYILGFSFAYVRIDAGLGALILFGGVQVTMFAGAMVMGDRPPAQRWVGMGLGLFGLAWLLAPTESATVDPTSAGLMACAALGWGVYSLIGRGSQTPLADTAASFLCAAPLGVLVWWLSGEGLTITPYGLSLAIVSGVVTSGLGYALWYTILPSLDATVAGLAQLTVPVIAVVAGVMFLGETLGVQALLAGGLVLFGVGFGLFRSSGRSTPKGRRQ